MKRLCLLLSLFAALASAPAQNEAQTPDTQTGNFLYKMPTGWNPVEKADTTVIYAPSQPPGTATFIAIAANDLEGDLKNSFNVLWTGFTKSYRVLEGGRISPRQNSKGYEALETTAVAADQSGKRWMVHVVGAQYKNRIETIMFMSDLPNGATFQADYNIFQKFLSSVSFGESLPGAPVPPAANAPAEVTADKPHQIPPGMLEGIYVGYSISSSGKAGLRRLHFNPDGWVVRDVPQEGMIGFDFTAYRNARDTNRSWVGRYRVEGNQINIVWQDYADDREILHLKTESAHPGLNQYVPMCRCTGKKFSGKYNLGLTGAGQYLQFFPDDTFIDHQVLDQMLVPSPYYDHPRIQRGTYSIQSQTIIFTFADGRRGMRTFIAPKAQETSAMFDWIGLGWHTLYEDHYHPEP